MIVTEGADGAPLSFLALIAAMLAVAILTVALRRVARRPDIAGALLCAAGLCLAMGATVYVHDLVNMPEAAMVTLTGLGIGYLLTRQGIIPPPPRLAPALHLLAGIVGAVTTFAAWRNPLAFGLDAGIGPRALLLLAPASIALILVATWQLHGNPPARAARAMLGAGTGALAALMGLTLGNPPLILCGGLLTGAGIMLGRH